MLGGFDCVDLLRLHRVPLTRVQSRNCNAQTGTEIAVAGVQRSKYGCGWQVVAPLARQRGNEALGCNGTGTGIQVT